MDSNESIINQADFNEFLIDEALINFEKIGLRGGYGLIDLPILIRIINYSFLERIAEKFDIQNMLYIDSGFFTDDISDPDLNNDLIDNDYLRRVIIRLVRWIKINIFQNLQHLQRTNLYNFYLDDSQVDYISGVDIWFLIYFSNTYCKNDPGLPYLRYSISPIDIVVLRKIFRQIDTDEDRRVTFEEISEILNRRYLSRLPFFNNANGDFCLKSVPDNVSIYDTNNDNFIDFEEFFVMMAEMIYDMAVLFQNSRSTGIRNVLLLHYGYDHPINNNYIVDVMHWFVNYLKVEFDNELQDYEKVIYNSEYIIDNGEIVSQLEQVPVPVPAPVPAPVPVPAPEHHFPMRSPDHSPPLRSPPGILYWEVANNDRVVDGADNDVALDGAYDDDDDDDMFGINLAEPFSYERKTEYDITRLSNKELDKHKGKIKIEKTQTVIDPIMMDEINIHDYIKDDVDNIVFIYEKEYYLSTKSIIGKFINMTTTDNAIVFDCRGIGFRNVNYDYPYVSIKNIGIILNEFSNVISLENAIAITKANSGQYFFIKGTNDVLISTVIDNVLNGRYPNGVAAGHCQSGKSAIVYDIQTFEPEYTISLTDGEFTGGKKPNRKRKSRKVKKKRRKSTRRR
jgi:hypothetical protein